jgi:hypothetical protein
MVMLEVNRLVLMMFKFDLKSDQGHMNQIMTALEIKKL